MGMMAVLQLLFVGIWCTAIGICGAQVTLAPVKGYARLGDQFTFTVVSDDPVDSGLLFIMRAVPPQTMCMVNLSSGETFRNIDGYDCGATREPGTYSFQILNVTSSDNNTWSCLYGRGIKSNNSTLSVRASVEVNKEVLTPKVVSPDGPKIGFWAGFGTGAAAMVVIGGIMAMVVFYRKKVAVPVSDSSRSRADNNYEDLRRSTLEPVPEEPSTYEQLKVYHNSTVVG